MPQIVSIRLMDGSVFVKETTDVDALINKIFDGDLLLSSIPLVILDIQPKTKKCTVMSEQLRFDRR